MKMQLIYLASVLMFSHCLAQSHRVPDSAENGRMLLPNGWSLSPAGHSIPLGDLPLNMVVSASKKYIAITNNGQSTQSVELFDVAHERITDSVNIPKSWFGLKFSSDEHFLYASGGNDNRILKYAIDNGKLKLSDTFLLGKKWPEKISPAGFDIDERKQLMYIVTKENNSLYVIDLNTKNIIKQLPLPAEAYTCLLSRDRTMLFVSCWGCAKILMVRTDTINIDGSIAVGDHPNAIALSKNGRNLFVANSNDNSVSIIDIVKRIVIETLNTALFVDAPTGSTTNALALNGKGNTLYIANADNNCLSVFDVSKPGFSHSKGFIPVGWYPTSVAVIGKKIFVANGKGLSSMANPHGPMPVDKKENVEYQHGEKDKNVPVQYIAGLFRGALSIVDEPNEQQLGTYSREVYKNTPYDKSKELTAEGEPGNPIPMMVGSASPVKYVFYIIKENRTYDQVLGDVAQGNGDTSLVLFGKHITPNQHAITREFVLLDNFYCDAEVSADGHNWSMGAYATDYLEKTWPTSYGGRGGSYDGEGNRSIANNKKGFIWDYCYRNKVSFRTYGEFADDYKPNIAILRNHLCPYYTGWNLNFRDTSRFYQWKRDFDSLLQAGKLPKLNTIRFGNDHTEGMRKGRPSPYAHVADNDLAVGMFVEYLSKSSVWKESVVFILEDDAQNGADHVDAHRSPVYIAGGYVKRHFVDHTMYSTSSVLRTIELILGIPPMSQYDAAATPMWRSFSSTADTLSFSSLPANIDLGEKNIAWNEMAKKSAGFDFSKEDRVPDLEFNEVLWKGLKGVQAITPVPIRAAFLKPIKKADDD